MSTQYEQAINPSEMFQNFVGEIIPTVAPITDEAPDQITVDLLHARVPQHGAVFIPNQPPNPALDSWGGENAIAKIEFGGPNPNNASEPETQMLVLPLTSQFVDGMQNDGHFKPGFLEHAKAGKYLLVVQDKNSGGSARGMAVLSRTTHNGLVGRHSNLSWYDNLGNEMLADFQGNALTPFASNRSISREQAILSVNPEGLSVRQRSDKSETRLVTRATQEQRAVLQVKQEANKPVEPEVHGFMGRIAARKLRNR